MGFFAISLHFYEGLFAASLHFYEGLFTALLHFYEGLFAVSLHFYEGLLNTFNKIGNYFSTYTTKEKSALRMF